MAQDNRHTMAMAISFKLLNSCPPISRYLSFSL